MTETGITHLTGIIGCTITDAWYDRREHRDVIIIETDNGPKAWVSPRDRQRGPSFGVDDPDDLRRAARGSTLRPPQPGSPRIGERVDVDLDEGTT